VSCRLLVAWMEQIVSDDGGEKHEAAKDVLGIVVKIE
jgi:hypothetical protein